MSIPEWMQTEEIKDILKSQSNGSKSAFEDIKQINSDNYLSEFEQKDLAGALANRNYDLVRQYAKINDQRRIKLFNDKKEFWSKLLEETPYTYIGGKRVHLNVKDFSLDDNMNVLFKGKPYSEKLYGVDEEPEMVVKKAKVQN